MDFINDSNSHALNHGPFHISENDLEKFAGDEDLCSLLGGPSLSSAEFISDLPDDFQLPFFEPMVGLEESSLDASLGGDTGFDASFSGEIGFGASLVGDVGFGDDPWKELSDGGSDSGIDCFSVKQEPQSPTSSHCSSDFSLDGNRTMVMDTALISQQSENDLLEQFTLDSLGGGTLFESNVKLETPDTPPLTPVTPQTYVVSQSILKPSIATGLNSAANGAARAITFTANGSRILTTSKGNGIQFVLPPQTSQNVAPINKVKIQPRPPLSTANTSTTSSTKPARPQGKPLVLTPEEFAKLTAKGILKLQSPTPQTTVSTTNSPSIKKPILSCNSYSTPVSRPTSLSPVTMSTHTTSSLATHSSNSRIGPLTDLDLKTWKRQQRMIKNRESACLSRKRKKEYLGKVESQLHNIVSQNEKLHHENNLLRKKVDQLSKENGMLKRALPSQRPSLGTVKAVTSLLAIGVLFSFSFQDLGLFSTKRQALSNQIPAFMSQSGGIHHGRHLMSFNDLDPDFKVDVSNMKYNINDIEQTMNLLRKSMDTSLTNMDDSTNSNSKQSSAMREFMQYNLQLSSMCPLYYNSTESQRLMNELTGWVRGQKADFERKGEELNVERHGKRKRRTRKYGGDMVMNFDSVDIDQRRLIEGQQYTMPRSRPGNYEMQVFNEAEQQYEHFMDAVHRRNDTFYVVSFKNDHLLLPAVYTNQTMGRPRMSLVMPAMGLNATMTSPEGSMAMMQIDCEVTATRLLHIHKSAIPPHMRDNATFYVPPHSSKTAPAPATRAPSTNRSGNHPINAHLPRDSPRTKLP